MFPSAREPYYGLDPIEWDQKCVDLVCGNLRKMRVSDAQVSRLLTR